MKSCPLCDSAAPPLFDGGQHIFYRCRACRLAFVDPKPSLLELEQFYDRFHQTNELGGIYGHFEERMSADFATKAKLVKDRLGGEMSSRILEVGSGKGFFVSECLKLGLDAEGVDLSHSAVAYGIEKLGVRLTQGRLEALQLTFGGFDAVTLWASIEHVHKPVELLSAARRVLKPGGLLFLDTGLGDDVLERLLPGATQWYDAPQHLFVFSE